jgi:hypothetical protein
MLILYMVKHILSVCVCVCVCFFCTTQFENFPQRTYMEHIMFECYIV